MTELCKITEQNRAIITLDQEKVYDKIRHDYLWRVLQEMNIPESLINTIKSLYTNVETTVILNSEMSKKFLITRGVQQGNPLSCLLFNFTIEPMSHLLRTTEKLTSLNIDTPSVHHRVILSLFVDDATVFLSENDNPKVLFKILDTWCIASRAKFNKEKTVILPVGTTDYRENVISTCSLQKESPHTLPNLIQILKDGE